jgi:hypothetical protein
LQEFQHFEIIALDVEIACGVEVHRFLNARAERSRRPLSRNLKTLGFAFPTELILLEIVRDVLAAEVQQFVYVEFAFDKTLREYGAELFPLGCLNVE